MLNIKEDLILRKKVGYVCKTMSLEVVSPLKDQVGVYAYVLRDKQNRRYLFACKRYVDWSPKNYGRVSFTKELIMKAANGGYTLIMLIEEKHEEGSRDYIYTFSPHQILQHKDTYENEFNNQTMLNFNIDLAVNMEWSRRREITNARIEFIKPNNKNKEEANLIIKRFL